MTKIEQKQEELITVLVRALAIIHKEVRDANCYITNESDRRLKMYADQVDAIQSELLSLKAEAEKEVSDAWIAIEDKLPEPGFEVLLFNKKWINEDFNPKGVRIGFKDDVCDWLSAYWCNNHDEYHTRISDEDDNTFTDFEGKNQIPTHWMEIKPTETD